MNKLTQQLPQQPTHKLSNKELRDLVENTKGRIMKVQFIKKDNSVREMLCRMGVKLKLTGTGKLYEKENLVTVYDMVNRGYRTVNLDTMLSFKCGKMEWKSE